MFNSSFEQSQVQNEENQDGYPQEYEQPEQINYKDISRQTGVISQTLMTLTSTRSSENRDTNQSSNQEEDPRHIFQRLYRCLFNELVGMYEGNKEIQPIIQKFKTEHSREQYKKYLGEILEVVLELSTLNFVKLQSTTDKNEFEVLIRDIIDNHSKKQRKANSNNKIQYTGENSSKYIQKIFICVQKIKEQKQSKSNLINLIYNDFLRNRLIETPKKKFEKESKLQQVPIFHNSNESQIYSNKKYRQIQDDQSEKIKQAKVMKNQMKESYHLSNIQSKMEEEISDF